MQAPKTQSISELRSAAEGLMSMADSPEEIQEHIMEMFHASLEFHSNYVGHGDRYLVCQHLCRLVKTASDLVSK